MNEPDSLPSIAFEFPEGHAPLDAEEEAGLTLVLASGDDGTRAAVEAFLTRHRLRVEVSSSEFDRYDRNLNTAELPGRGSAMVVAHQTVFHDAARPSHVLIPMRSVRAEGDP